MVDYLIKRSENFVAESVVLDGGPNEEVSEDPYDIISDFVDDFASTKRNFLSRLSGWLLSDTREDKIDDFVREMEINGFWLLNRRESVAQTLLKNVDFKNIYHCNMSFKSLEDLEEHKLDCGFRTMICTNEGCDSRFSAAQGDHHDSICPFKILKCEQNCPATIMRREMDRHCITICPMKLVKCPFYSVGCHSSIPQCTIEQHRSENLRSHLVYILQAVHKEASAEDLKERVEELIKLSSPGKLAVVRDARALTFMIKDLDAKLGPLKIKTTQKSSDEVRDSTDKKEESAGGSPTDQVKFEESPKAKTESVNSPSRSSDSKNDSSQEKEKSVESLTNVNVQLEQQPDNKNVVASISEQEYLKESPHEREDGLAEENKTEAQMEKSSQVKVAATIKHEHFTSSTITDSSLGKDVGLALQNKSEVEMEKSPEDKEAEPVERFTSSPIKVEVHKVEKQTGAVAESEESTKPEEESKESYNREV
ncbi:homogentisate solanesyltransferase [Handroanthus impetiginosus]|uniref:Homogentisate solanesyltransferase n=1 Tax=Handroanthus impetiginosus TaxID=429701 RepID=A0A2G9HRS2_9LAMI|nr:homogentisate solanesyltransferase [Handroanthus impetiginosus]